MPNIEPPNTSPPQDPRIALAAAQLAEARAKLAEKEAETRRSRPTLAIGKRGKLAVSASRGALLFIGVAAAAFTAALFLMVFWLQMSATSVVLGLVTFPVALIMLGGLLSFVSCCFLAIIESTANGKVEIEPPGDPREWIWTLPNALAMLGVAAAVAWLVSWIIPDHGLWVFAIVSWLLYPFLQLSVMETTKLINPFSLPVFRSLVTRPLAWLAMYGCSVILMVILVMIVRSSGPSFSYLKLLFFGPIVAATLFAYAWLLGQLTHFIATGDDG